MVGVGVRPSDVGDLVLGVEDQRRRAADRVDQVDVIGSFPGASAGDVEPVAHTGRACAPG